ncbi:MAG: hypothetical protein R3211_01235 [Balneolaceae bacterium]|nr:hypothetical protein [Balneolaceae bacterium]
MEASFLLAAISGLIGAAVMTIFIYLFKALGLSLDIPYLLGTRLTASVSNKGKIYATGLTLHLLSGAIWGMLYILFAMAMAVKPDWALGILYGVGHGIFIGAMIGILSESHPQIGEDKPISDPGMFGHRWGKAIPYILLLLHILFGTATLLAYNWLFHPEFIPSI